MDNTCMDCGAPIGRKAKRCQSCRSKHFWSDPKQRERQAEALRGRPLSADHRAATAAGLRGKPKTPEHRAKLAVAQRAMGEAQRERSWAASYVRGAPDDCWEWQGTRFQRSNYGRWGQKRAHIEAWERDHGGPVPDGLLVLHRCDNPPCVNPAHLYVGTHAQNARDRKVRERGVRGSRVNTNKLTEEQVYAIRAACDAGEKQAVLAEQFGVTQPMIGFIARRQSWAWLPER